MASNNTISITFKLDGDNSNFKKLTIDAEGLSEVLSATVSNYEQLHKKLINTAALATGFKAVQDSVNQLSGVMRGLADVYAEQEINDRKLETTMRNSMDATDDQIRQIKELCVAQEQQGVISATVQTAAAQELATYLGLSSSLETLLPVLNDMAAQQYGVGASAESATSIATMLGKVMNGQTSALSRYGYTFDEIQENILKYGTEAERAAVLAEVVGASVGGMNAQLAQTDSGKQAQLANRIDAVKTSLGQMANAAMPFVTMSSEAITALASIGTLTAGIKTLTTTLYSGAKALTVSAAAFVKEKVAALAAAAAKKVAAAATVAWTAVQKVLNLVLIANPIGIIITAIGALVAGFVAAYKNCEGFRQIVDKVWAAVGQLAGVVKNSLVKAFEWLVEECKMTWDWLKKILGLKVWEAVGQLATVIKNSLVKAFEWVVEKCKVAWDWLKKILGLGGKKAEVEVEVTTSGSSPEMDALYAKYKNFTPPDDKKKKSKSKDPAVWTEDATTLKEITDNIEILNKQLQEATVEEAALINQQIEAWEAKADAIKNAGKAAEDNSPLWREDATTLREINDNLEILQDKLQDASAEEAAALNQQIEAWEAKADAIKSAGKAVEEGLAWNASASTLSEISNNIDLLNKQLQEATIEEAALINQQIDAWEAKADAIKNAGREMEEAGVSVGKSLKDSWGSVKGIASGIESITEALEDNTSAWDVIVGVVDGFIGLYEGFQKVINIISSLTGVTNLLTAAKEGEAVASTAAATAAVTGSAQEIAASTASAATKSAETTANVAAAASGALAAHSGIPFVGIALGLAAVAAIIAAMSSLPKFASGGVVSGPTLALVGEYAGASNNPEVIAPLDKLRGMLQEPGGVSSNVRFEIQGRTLVGILSKENNIIKRR